MAGPRPRPPAWAGRDAEASILLGVEHPVGWPTGWPRCARPSKRPGCCWPSGPVVQPFWPASPRRRPASWPSGPTVNAGTRRFLDLCRDEGLLLQVGEVHYFAHWIAPRGTPRRFDTRFFVAAAPPGQQAAHRCGRDHRRHLDLTAPCPRRPPQRGLRAHLPDHPQPAGHRPFRHCRRAVGGGRERLALGARPSSRV